MNEDTDDMYDDLFKKHGSVVFKRNDQKPPTAEVDDDAESLSCKLLLSLARTRNGHKFAVYVLCSCRVLAAKYSASSYEYDG